MSHYFKNDPTLGHEEINIKLDFLGDNFIFHSDKGVFSKQEADHGSLLLLQNLLKMDLSGSLLDVGCGYGLLGVILGKKYPELLIEMVDVNQRALQLCELNLSANAVKGKVYLSDGYQAVEGLFDTIISNPPIRAGKVVVHRILREAKDHLIDGGKLVIVMRKSHGAPSALKLLQETYSTAKIIDRSEGFYIIEAIR